MELEIKSTIQVLLFSITIIVILLAKDSIGAASDLRNETDRLALLNIKLQISGDPQGVLNSWNDSHHHCHWEGVTCNLRHQRVVNLTLTGKNLFGSISSYVGNLSSLKSIELGGNRLHGEIPQEIGRLFRLRNLNLSNNELGGEIPVNLSQCLELRIMAIMKNKLVGKLPPELGYLKKLEFLDLYQNNLTKEIPSSFGNLSSLQVLGLSNNNLEGSLPNEIGSLRNLWRLSLGINNFSGLLPPSIFNMSTLYRLSMVYNFLEGELPSDIGLKLPHLQRLFIGFNQFYGVIPVSIANATDLEEIDFPGNKFQGQVPTNLGNLPNLQVLNLGGNLLGGNANGDLDFITSLTNCSKLQNLAFSHNNFGGQLPEIIGNLSIQLQYLALGSNGISGTIPESLMRLENLYALAVDYNFLTGTIPRDFGKLHSLQVLGLGNNMLKGGEIPYSFCNLTSLYQLMLDNNNLEGTLPSCLGSMSSLRILYASGNKLSGIISPAIFGNSFSPSDLDLSYNSFTGSFPPEIGRFTNIVFLNVSYNNFSGQIPGSLGGCLELQSLSVQSNFFHGTIPETFTSLKSIEYLDLSRNNLTEQIPKGLERLPRLIYLNLSFNNLEGEVPKNGVFENSSQIILDGNFKLCGGNPKLRLPLCRIHRKKTWKLLIIAVVSSLFILIMIISNLLYCYRRRYQKSNSFPETLGGDNILRISYHELQRATEGFSQGNVVGSGSFGVVYKGKLDVEGGKLVAVKVLDLHKAGVSKSLKAECNALKNIRHRNLVPLLSYCSSIDSKGNEFKAIIYDYMENGSLEMWLHPGISDREMPRNLNLLQKINIAIDVASALQYLHHHCGFIIAHCDLKPSNILLNSDFTAHVGDFGLAKLLSNPTLGSSANETGTSLAIKGTIGYAAPEYAMGREPTIQGDVYSYGILLLEMFTGKRPTDETFIGDLNLRNYVKQNTLERVEEILDPLLSSRQPNHLDTILELERFEEKSTHFWSENDCEMKCIISILKIGLKCSETSSNDRMDMNEVTRQLQVLREAFLRGEKNIEHPTAQ